MADTASRVGFDWNMGFIPYDEKWKGVPVLGEFASGTR
jgi:hypothetical protein